MGNRLQHMEDCFITLVQGQMSNLEKIDAKEMGEVIDIIKDLEEAQYYCAITSAMQENKMYYSEGNNNNITYVPQYPQYDEIEYYSNDYGRSPKSRKYYMESKELHHDKNTKIQKLEKYANELSEDILEMIRDASPEERQMLINKINSISNTIQSM